MKWLLVRGPHEALDAHQGLPLSLRSTGIMATDVDVVIAVGGLGAGVGVQERF